jgi:hypothetical protein
MFHCSVVYTDIFGHFCCMSENYKPMKKVTAIQEIYTNFYTNTKLFVVNQILLIKYEAAVQYSVYYLNDTVADFP